MDLLVQRILAFPFIISYERMNKLCPVFLVKMLALYSEYIHNLSPCTCYAVLYKLNVLIYIIIIHFGRNCQLVTQLNFEQSAKRSSQETERVVIWNLKSFSCRFLVLFNHILIYPMPHTKLNPKNLSTQR